jgi:hypothetical protein
MSPQKNYAIPRGRGAGAMRQFTTAQVHSRVLILLNLLFVLQLYLGTAQAPGGTAVLAYGRTTAVQSCTSTAVVLVDL